MIDPGRLKTLLLQTGLHVNNPPLYQFLQHLSGNTDNNSTSINTINSNIDSGAATGPPGPIGPAGPAPSGTGYVHVTSSVLDPAIASIPQSDITGLTSSLAGKASTAHHTTHEPGGSDPLTVDAIPATGSLRTLGTGANQATAGNDSRLSNSRTPTAHHATHETGGSDAIVALSGAVITTGTVADARLSSNIPKLNIDNTFAGNQGASNSFFVGMAPIIPDTKSIRVENNYYEKSRTAALGHWTVFTPSVVVDLGTITLNTIFTSRYTLFGKTMVISIYWDITLSSTPTVITFDLPVSAVAINYTASALLISSGFGGMMQTPGSGTTINLYRNTLGSGSWPSGSSRIAGTHLFEIA